jgi:hypothetical protein
MCKYKSATWIGKGFSESLTESERFDILTPRTAPVQKERLRDTRYVPQIAFASSTRDVAVAVKLGGA